MLCDKCKKKEATIHVKKVAGGKIESLHLCADCAREKEEQGVLGALGFNLAEVLFNLGELAKPAPAEESQESAPAGADPGVTCPVCGWNMEKLQSSNGRLGCPECYRSFSEIISDALNRIQRGRMHIGKRPDRSDPLLNAAALRIEITRTRKKLAELVRREEYEQAAVCRDRLNVLNGKLKTLEEQGVSDEQ
ncbi:MAG: UvrB/UvrC motif-containing protein [Lentisphaeria bacterium]|nr:UvrB/UvrC motif-containing protein [Lentisphaeria bacterium]